MKKLIGFSLLQNEILFSTKIGNNIPNSLRINMNQLEPYLQGYENDFYHFRLTLDAYSALVFDAIIKGL